ncbi:MAG: HlyD family efflux transporter periplasmic adaptor subunit [Oscillospiraceae bacterium]
MKQGTVITRVIMAIIFLFVLLYMGVYLVEGLKDPYKTVLTYNYTVNDSATATGFLVRDEIVIPQTGALADIHPNEGEKVARGETVAVLYQSSDALSRKTEIRALELELDQLDYALRHSDNVGDAGQMDADIVASLAKLRSTVSAGNLTGLEDQTLALRSMVLKRTDTGATTDESLAAIEENMRQVAGNLRSLKAVSGQESTTVSAEQSGVFSGLVDGYEALITPAMLPTLTAPQLAELSKQTVPPNEDAIGKLIVSHRWSYAVLVDEKDALRVSVGDTVPVLFTHDFVGEIPMRLDRMGDTVGGKTLLILSTDRNLAETTLLRRQTADIVFEACTGVRVPKEALRTVQRTVTDPDTKAESQVTQTGVYVLVGAQAEFKPVEVLQEGADFYLLRGTATNRKVLRAGDEVIISSEELFDGKVID